MIVAQKVLSGKEETVRINSLPKKSTLSDANKGRKVDFFEEIYTNLLEKYGFILSDSRIKEALSKTNMEKYIVDNFEI